MARLALSVITLFSLAFGQALASECCNTGYEDYTWCVDYCCDPNYIWPSSYDRCCSYSYEQVTINKASDSDCSPWFSTHIWVAVLIGLVSLLFVIGVVACCVCCVKGCCTTGGRARPVVVQGHQGPGVLMVQNNAAQQMQGAPMPQSGQAAYPPGYAGSSNMGFQPSQPYANPAFEKTSGPPRNKY